MVTFLAGDEKSDMTGVIVITYDAGCFSRHMAENIDIRGLDEMDKRILETLLVNFNGGPVGLNSLAVAIGEEADTIEDVYEPYLIQEGYLMRTAQGRVATGRTWQLLGLTPRPRRGRAPASSGAENDPQPDLF